MRKRFVLILVCMLSIASAGCGTSGSGRSSQASSAETAPETVGSQKTQEDTGNAQSDSSEEESDSSGAGQQSDDTEQATTDLSLDGTEVSTQFFKITVPDNWRYNVTYHYYQDPDEGNYTLEIFDRASVTASQGQKGLVFSIALHRSYPEELDTIPSDYLGLLKKDDGGYFYVVLDYPESTQYEDSSRASYEAVGSQADQIRETIEGLNGYTFETGPAPQKQ